MKLQKSLALTSIALAFTACQPKVETTIEQPITYPQSEFDQARVVIMHEPEEELSLGSFHPDAALFKCYLDPDAARAEHREYQNILSNQGVEVLTIRNILLSRCVDANGKWIEGPATDSLRQMAGHCISFTTIGEFDAKEVADYKASLLKQYTPEDIIRIIFQQPEIILKKTAINTGVEAEYRLDPLMNLFFMRDQMISTSKGLVIGKMNSSQRKRECDLVEFCLNKIGRRPIYRIQGEDAFLEGGDFIPTTDYAMIGCGLRTNQIAINQLMDNDLLGKDTLVVVKDPWKSQIQMHLDTYFNVIDKDLVTLCSNRVNAKPGDKDFLTVDIYVRQTEGGYKQLTNGKSFLDFLAERNIEIIPIQPKDEDNFANNFLCIKGREIVMVDGQSDELKKQLADKGVEVHWAKVTNLTHGYGACHCMTQMIGRSATK